jgi:subtilase family serine protease
MKNKAIALAAVLFLGISIHALAQQPIRSSSASATAQSNVNRMQKKPNTETAVLPDLVVTEISYDQTGSVRVQVMNEGNGNAKASHLALMIMKGSGPASGADKIWTVAVPVLKAHTGYSATFNISPFKYADRAFLARIDRSDEVKESDESNNDRFDSSRVIK